MSYSEERAKKQEIAKAKFWRLMHMPIQELALKIKALPKIEMTYGKEYGK